MTNDITAVRADLVQLEILLKEAIAKLSSGFIGAHEALARQQSLDGHLDPECEALVAKACAHLDSALTALQFEDIAAQLIASAHARLSDGGERPANGKNISIPQHHMGSGDIELF